VDHSPTSGCTDASAANESAPRRGFVSLSISHPAIAAEWHPDRNGTRSPNDVSPTSHFVAWWRCGKNSAHEWEREVRLRTKAASPDRGFISCPDCRSESSSLAALYPDIAREWHATLNNDLKPTQVTPGSNRTVWWQCSVSDEHVYERFVYLRTGKGALPCPFCSGRKADTSRSLATLFPTVAKEWHPTANNGLIPNAVKWNSTKSVWWLCEKKHEWTAQVAYRTKDGSACPQCSGNRVNEDTGLATVNPELAAEWHPTLNRLLNPDIKGTYSKTLKRQNRRIPQRHSKRKRRLQPSDVSIYSKEMVHWQCKKGALHVWKATVVSRAVQGNGCPFCSGRRKCADNSLAAKYPAVAKLWHPTRNSPLTPSDVTPSENRKVSWRCPRSATHVWRALIYNVVNSHELHGTSGCPFCRGRKVDKDNCLATTHPEVAKNWHPTRNLGLLPTDVTAHSRKAAWWQCPKVKAHRFEKSIGEVVKSWERSGSTGCGLCKGSRAAIDNCLKTLYPEVSKLWHPIRNKPLLPSAVKPMSKTVAWWQCDRSPDHEWPEKIALVTKRYKEGAMPCHQCAGRSAAAGNNLWEKYPEVGKYWDAERNMPTRPWEVMPGSAKRHFWRCREGDEHRWEGTVGNTVAAAKAGKEVCPFCRKLKRQQQ